MTRVVSITEFSLTVNSMDSSLFMTVDLSTELSGDQPKVAVESYLPIKPYGCGPYGICCLSPHRSGSLSYRLRGLTFLVITQ